jgi:peroxiredoxin
MVVGARVQRRLLQAGQPAADFSLSGLDKETRTLENVLSSGPALLVFFKNTCPVCQYALPFLERLHRSQPNGVQVFGISQDGSRDTRKFAEEFGLTFPILLDEESDGYRVSNAYGISHVPSLFLADPGGKLAMAWYGFSKADMEALGRRFSFEVFRPGEDVPAWKAG